MTITNHASASVPATLPQGLSIVKWVNGKDYFMYTKGYETWLMHTSLPFYTPAKNTVNGAMRFIKAIYRIEVIEVTEL